MFCYLIMAGAFTQWRHKSLMGASAGGVMSRRYNVNMEENYSYFSNFDGKYLGKCWKLVQVFACYRILLEKSPWNILGVACSNKIFTNVVI